MRAIWRTARRSDGRMRGGASVGHPPVVAPPVRYDGGVRLNRSTSCFGVPVTPPACKERCDRYDRGDPSRSLPGQAALRGRTAPALFRCSRASPGLWGMTSGMTEVSCPATNRIAWRREAEPLLFVSEFPYPSGLQGTARLVRPRCPFLSLRVRRRCEAEPLQHCFGVPAPPTVSGIRHLVQVDRFGLASVLSRLLRPERNSALSSVGSLRSVVYRVGCPG